MASEQLIGEKPNGMVRPARTTRWSLFLLLELAGHSLVILIIAKGDRIRLSLNAIYSAGFNQRINLPALLFQGLLLPQNSGLRRSLM
jgi:hypothetical protein